MISAGPMTDMPQLEKLSDINVAKFAPSRFGMKNWSNSTRWTSSLREIGLAPCTGGV
jgi:hypothetical protein